MATLDWLVVLVYFAVILGLAWWVFRRGKDTPDDYFLANRNLGWFIVGASIFASNIGSEHLVGLAGSGATSGVAMAHYELHAWAILVLGWLFVPFYMRSRVNARWHPTPGEIVRTARRTDRSTVESRPAPLASAPRAGAPLHG